MTPRRIARRTRLAAVTAATMAVALAACTRGGSLDVNAPAPTVAAEADTIPALPPSTLEAPLAFDMGTAIRMLDSIAPKSFGNIEERRPLGDNTRAHFAFAVERSPFVVSVRENTVQVTTVVRYQGKGWYKPPVAPEVSGSCGVNEERPRALVQIATVVRLGSNWRLRPRTQLKSIEPFSKDRIDQCKVTMLNIDVTEKVMDATKGVMEKVLPKLDEKIATVDVRSPIEHVWEILQRPIRLTDSVWLAINPTSVTVSDVGAKNQALTTSVGLTASPRIVTGLRPELPATPLPPVKTGAVGNGLHVLMEAAVDYGVGNALLTKALRGKKISASGHELEIRDLKLSGIGNGRVALALRFQGATSGLIYFVGTPRYNVKTGELEVPDLDFDVASAILLVKGFEWLKHDEIRDFLRQRGHFPVGDVMKRVSDLAQKGMNRQLGRVARLEAEIKSVEPLGVHATRQALLIRARGDCTAKLTLGLDSVTVARR